jgi:hypothetical protein
VDPQFRLVFLSVLGLAVVLLIFGGALAILAHNPMTPAENSYSELLSHGFMSCVGFLAGGALSTRMNAPRPRTNAPRAPLP